RPRARPARDLDVRESMDRSGRAHHDPFRRSHGHVAQGHVSRAVLMSFRLFSSAFAEGGTIPRLHTCAGADVSPSLEWSNAPAGTRSFALIVDDPDAPSKTWTHWVLFDMAANTRT